MISRLPLVCVAALAAACVSQGKYDDLLKTADDARANAARANSELVARGRDCDANMARLNGKLRELQSGVDDQTAINAELRAGLQASGKSADQLLAEKGLLATELKQSRLRLEELRKAQAAAEARAALFRDLALKFQRMIGAGEVSISVRDGRMILSMPNDVLFDSGRTEIKKSGLTVLEEMAGILKTVPRHFQVAGHTDNVPIQTERFPSNWELSTARAVEVIHFLTSHGVAPTLLSAAGFGEFNPVATNNDETGRKRNRRIEITLLPNIDELVAVPDGK